MLTTILFDLDGTLLPMDFDKFIKVYFYEMGMYFKDIIEPEKLTKFIWIATEAMVKNTDWQTNETVFFDVFSQLINSDVQIYTDRFNSFYDQGFLKTRACVGENEFVKKSVQLLKSKGYHLVIATNPLFPEKAIQHRIRWAGLNREDFSYVTSYERNHFCKPQLHFYEEILKEIGEKPECCLMVGNDIQEDIIASKLGIKTFLINDFLIHRTEEEIVVDYQGNYEAFHQFAKSLPAI